MSFLFFCPDTNAGFLYLGRNTALTWPETDYTLGTNIQ